MSEAAEQVAQEVRRQVEAALAGADRPEVWGPSKSPDRAKAVPRRMWPSPGVVRKRQKSFLDRCFLLVDNVTDPIGNLADWFIEKISFRRRKRALRGGWRSLAGSLLAAHHTAVRRFLVVGGTGLHLVYIGELGSETGWSVPREKVRGVEHLEWDGGMPHKATLRFHFTDGSWGDVVVVGQTWRQMLSQFPPVPGK